MPALELRDAVQVVTGILTLAGVFWALRSAVTRLEIGQTELLRQVGAIHKRLDDYGQRIQKAEVNHAVLTERVDNLRESQRFKLKARLEAAAAGQAPMFAEGDDG
jgi:hypothetical protein